MGGSPSSPGNCRGGGPKCLWRGRMGSCCEQAEALESRSCPASPAPPQASPPPANPGPRGGDSGHSLWCPLTAGKWRLLMALSPGAVFAPLASFRAPLVHMEPLEEGGELGLPLRPGSSWPSSGCWSSPAPAHPPHILQLSPERGKHWAPGLVLGTGGEHVFVHTTPLGCRGHGSVLPPPSFRPCRPPPLAQWVPLFARWTAGPWSSGVWVLSAAAPAGWM